MSYELHVHRAADYSEASENPIGRDQWEAWVTGAPDFAFDQSTYVRYNDEGGERCEFGAVWTGHPHGKQWAFFYDEGAVTTGKPDEHVLGRMARMAEALGARLQGDDGEFYGPDGEELPED